MLTGRVNSSGHLPVTFVKDEQQLPRPVIDGPRDASLYPSAAGQTFAAAYAEGADVGYQWFARKGLTQQDPFGFGLSYTQFRFSSLEDSGGKDMAISFSASNVGGRAGRDCQDFRVWAGG